MDSTRARFAVPTSDAKPHQLPGNVLNNKLIGHNVKCATAETQGERCDGSGDLASWGNWGIRAAHSLDISAGMKLVEDRLEQNGGMNAEENLNLPPIRNGVISALRNMR
jgi:hypothetical protein